MKPEKFQELLDEIEEFIGAHNLSNPHHLFDEDIIRAFPHYKKKHMNERIKELAEQATTIEYGADRGFDRVTFDKEKFAELIIQECMGCVIWVGQVNNTISAEPIQTAMAINKRIQQRLGIDNE